MKIQLEKVVPEPLRDSYNSESTCWNADVELLSGTKIVVEAVSGKGKSTFVNSIYGIRKDFSGKILIDGKSTKEISIDEWSTIRAKRLSVVFQDLQLIPHLTVSENLALKNELTNNTSEEEQKELINQVGLSDKWNTPCGILSYGQQQRIAVIRALLQPFEVILLDEPFAHLDQENSHICYNMITEKAKKNNATIVLTTLNHAKIDVFDQHLLL